ncbi:MAG: polymerase [Treponema sp.]|nr:polymerase [Treponema sp.]
MCAVFNAVSVFAQEKIAINGALEWDKQEINAVVSLDMASSGLKLPNGRMQGEALIASEYIRLIRPAILNIQVDSSSTVADLVRRGEWSFLDVENLALQVRAVPPALSPDLSSLLAFYTLAINDISAALIRHQRPSEVPVTLTPVSAPAYTGIVIIAAENLPVYGTRSAALLRPCLFPKIWDTEMKLVFERNMLNPRAGAMVRYFSMRDIFAGGPSGLSREIAAVVGSRPLRIFAHSIFGIQPTDPIIGREDVLQIISNRENRSLLREGRVAIIIDDTLLVSPLPGDEKK